MNFGTSHTLNSWNVSSILGFCTLGKFIINEPRVHFEYCMEILMKQIIFYEVHCSHKMLLNLFKETVHPKKHSFFYFLINVLHKGVEIPRSVVATLRQSYAP